MRYTSGRRTIAKLRLTRRAGEWFALGAILLGLFLAIALIGGAQVALCKWKAPSELVTRCLAPLWRKR
jgi:hypothetical protein